VDINVMLVDAGNYTRAHPAERQILESAWENSQRRDSQRHDSHNFAGLAQKV